MSLKRAFAFIGLGASVLAIQPSAPDPVPAPLRNLTWGQLNFLQTTDIHGWLAGHLQEPSFAADWGDYISFATHMRKIAEDAGTDLLVVDTGDRIEGNGLYDSSHPKGRYTSDILQNQHIDVLSSGNHELYQKISAENEYLITVPSFKGSYLSSNIDIYEPKTGKRVPLAPRFKKFETPVQGLRIIAFGFLFDFTGNYNNTVVQPVEETIQEDWFQEAIRDRDVDLFLVVGHVPVHSKEYNALFRAIRGQQWRKPIHFFGGHHHIRDYAKYDDMAYGLASGRFMETIGFASISGLSTGSSDLEESSTASSLSFNRRYIDNNLWSFYHHTGLNETTFPTEKGRNVSEEVSQARSNLKLDRVIGCAPRDLWVSRVPYPSENSVYTWLEEKVLPDILRRDLREGKAAMAIINTGAIRFDLFKGRFTRDSVYTISPFISGFRFTKDVPYDKAVKILEVLNKQPGILSEGQFGALRSAPFLAPPEVVGRAQANENQDYNLNGDQAPLLNDAVTPSDDYDLIPGYTTKDDAGTDGDDTVHSPIKFYNTPNCIEAFIPSSSSEGVQPDIDSQPGADNPETVDLIYLDFVQPWIEIAAKFVGLDFDIEKDTEAYMPGADLGSVIRDWVEENWKCEELDQ